ncbi:S-methyl-5-thioribose-1-phosphate isomerase [candidate division WOR-3 bacterium]|uniref:S-methyl-5-thioribose-1-phosphate isomerase n=1 Tax=candidate division WOR-3 bacterium TaxID=2052148 RepID=A0A9D5K9X2_UNCW3|nr:S-methyl-5-thioribose-1-phosphate isomerase [candidate division WOR-3 bacterium]MBD3365101.1 S-methyl-5-thioribose-1-phosphate isomerase [candidate division WOR-3 bacterium]
MSKSQGGQESPPSSFRPPYEVIRWSERDFSILDQRYLPSRTTYLELRDIASASQAIRTLAVRGAPLIGVVAALAVAHSARRGGGEKRLLDDIYALSGTRPTAVNLFYALEKMRDIIENGGGGTDILNGALDIWEKERLNSLKMAACGQELLKDGMRVGTYCNTGLLAAPGLGTALGVIIKGFMDGKNVEIIVPETRPLLQGSRLTAWELNQWEIPYTLITESTLASVVPDLDAVFLGADRVVLNGDTANKVGTLGFAILSEYFHVPFYVVAPTTTFDSSLKEGDEIPIEQRDPDEVRCFGACTTAPDSALVFNPAFDVTPAHLISAFVSEEGITRPPYGRNLRK